MNKYLMSLVAAIALVLWAGPLNAQSSQERGTHQQGKVFLGAMIESTSDNAQHEGATIRQVMPNSPAAQAGLKRGDIITKVDNKKVEDFDELQEVLNQHKPGDKVTFHVMRKDKEQNLTVTLRQRPANLGREENEEQFGQQRGEFDREEQGQTERGRRGRVQQDEESETTTRTPAFLGVQARELTPEIASQSGVTAEQGVFISQVINGSPAAQAGLRPGDVITRVDGKEITNPQQLRQAIQRAGTNKQIKLEVMRGDNERTLTARLTQAPADQFGTPTLEVPRYGRFGGLLPGADQSQQIQDLQNRIRRLERRIQELEQRQQNRRSSSDQ
jgi:C-terminal processing protease CtpA/Prc